MSSSTSRPEQDLGRLLSSPEERDRLQAVDWLAAAETAGTAMRLVGLLSDASWRVRQAAARALSRRAEDEVSAAVLAALRRGHRDPGLLNGAIQVLIQTGADVLAVLLECLADPDAELRSYAALTLGDRGDIRAIPALLRALSDPDINTRVNAVEALGKLRASEATPTLVEMAAARDFFLSFPALLALSTIGDARAVPYLIPLLEDDLLQEAVIEALSQLGDEETLPPLVALLEKPEAPLGRIAQALVRLHDRYETRFGKGKELAAYVRTSVSPAVRSALLTTADRARDNELAAVARVLGWLDGEDVTWALVRLVDHPQTRTTAAEALVRRGKSATWPLLALLAAENLDTRQVAIQALGRIGNPEAVPALLRCLDTEAQMLPTVIGALAQIGDQRAYAPVRDLLGHADAGVRRAAAAALNAFGHPDTGKDMAERLQDASPLTREAAVRVAAYLGHPECLDLLLACGKDPDERVRRVVVEHLPFLEDERAISALRDALQDASAAVRAAAAGALADVAAAVALPLLQAALNDPEPWVRYFAVRALSRHHDPAVGDALAQKAREDDAMPVRVAATEALGQLPGNRFLPLLTELAAATDEHLSAAALTALGATGQAEALPPLLAALAAPREERRRAALLALGASNRPEAVEPLVQAAADSAMELARTAIEQLGWLRCPQAVEALIRLAEAPARRDLCMAVLAGLSEEQTPWLAAGLSHPHPDVRRTVVEALARQRGPAARELLQQALDDQAEAVRRAALAALALATPPGRRR